MASSCMCGVSQGRGRAFLMSGASTRAILGAWAGGATRSALRSSSRSLKSPASSYLPSSAASSFAATTYTAGDDLAKCTALFRASTVVVYRELRLLIPGNTAVDVIISTKSMHSFNLYSVAQ